MNPIVAHIRQSLRELYPPEELRALSMMICCDLLGLDALDIYMGKDITLSESKERELENIIFRLQKNEPIQYVCGFAQFGERKFKVAPGVLIPRPETAELVDLVVTENPHARHILDIGTGSGCIAISLDKRLPQAAVEAWDVSEAALAIARENNRLLDARVDFRLHDVFETPVCEDCLFDIMVSNPPYVTEREKQEMDANVLDWEPELALFVPDDDPLRYYRRIALLGQSLLMPGGKLYFEINQAYGCGTAQMLEEYHYHDVRIVKDFFGKDRIVTANR